MKQETQNLLSNLEIVVEKLNSAYGGIGSAGEHPFHTFAWSATEQGEFSFAELLRSLGFLKIIGMTILVKEWESKTMYYSQAQGVIQDLPILINTLESQLKTLRAYQLKTYIKETCTLSTDGFNGFEACEFIVGETIDGDWIGICPCFPKPHTVGYGQRITREVNIPCDSTIALQQQIEPILQKIKPAFVRYEAQVSLGVTWQSARKEEELIEKLLESSCIVEIWEFKKFMQDLGNLDVDEKYAFLELDKFANTYFQKPILYVLGNWKLFRLYLVGKIKNGDSLGAVTAVDW